MSTNVAEVETTIEFGPFTLFPTRRLLKKDADIVSIGSRALDILIALVERAGQIVTKNELMFYTWPSINVSENCLRGHLTTLRKSLGDSSDGAPYIKTISGRGYCFVAPITRGAAQHVAPYSCEARRVGLPPLLRRMIGRTDTTRVIADLLQAKRFVTIHGPGGIGKTTAATSVGHALFDVFEGAVHFVDLSEINESTNLLSGLTSAFGINDRSGDPAQSLIDFLKDGPKLLILDGCEHLIESIARLTERIFIEMPLVSILVTSRETLHVEGEHVHRLPALECPSELEEKTAEGALAFPAVCLMTERMNAHGHPFALTDDDAPLVSRICRKLDGIPLAIELAAARVSMLGLRETASQLDNSRQLFWHGRRTALPRHQTLTAALDWSYKLLNDRERRAFVRASVFAGPFTLESASKMAGDNPSGSAETLEVIEQLANKSLISHEVLNGNTFFRLLNTTRAYAHRKLVEQSDGV